MAAFLLFGTPSQAQSARPGSRWKARLATVKSAVAKPFARVSQQRALTPSAKPPSSVQSPAVQTTAPQQQYRQATRRLADLPIGHRGGYSKPFVQDDQEETIEDIVRRQAREDRDREMGGQGVDDLSDLERVEESRDSLYNQEESLSKLALSSRDIREIRPFIGYALKNIQGKELPEKLATTTTEMYVRPERVPIEFHWAASNLHHNPLYFEDPALERYGHSYHPLIQPFASAGRMTTQLIGLPYQMTIDPIHRRQYSLGWIRPGDCAPKLKYRIPLHKKAALVEAAAIGTGALILP